MPTIQVGRVEIDYELRRSATAAERRITVTPGHVEVQALSTDNEAEVADFLDRKRQWLFNTIREIETIAAKLHSVPRFMTGSKIPYRGRNVALTVRRTDGEQATVTYRNGFIVDLPHWIGRDAEQLVATELKLWLKHRARRDVIEIAAGYTKRFGIAPRSIRADDFKHGWGSCGLEGNILINWHLIFAPKKVLEYVVVHELAHLRHRSHEAKFWMLVGQLMPDYQSAQTWLNQHEAMLTGDFLTMLPQGPLIAETQ